MLQHFARSSTRKCELPGNVDVREHGKQDVPDLDVGNDGSCDNRNGDVDIVIVYGDGIVGMWICWM